MWCGGRGWLQCFQNVSSLSDKREKLAVIQSGKRIAILTVVINKIQVVILCHDVETGVCHSHDCSKSNDTYLQYKATVRLAIHFIMVGHLLLFTIVVSFRTCFSSDLKHKLISSSSDCVCARNNCFLWVLCGEKKNWRLTVLGKKWYEDEEWSVLPCVAVWMWKRRALLSVFYRVSSPFHWHEIQVLFFTISLKRLLIRMIFCCSQFSCCLYWHKSVSMWHGMWINDVKLNRLV